MEHKRLADTDVELPEIGLGTWAYTGGVEPLRRGFSLGAAFVDSAEGYGTEDIVGKAVREMREEVFIATKVSPEHFMHAPVIQAASNSLKRLGTDVIDLYQLHWPNPGVPIEETIGAMDELVDQGKIRFIGVCNFSLEQLKAAQAVTRHKIVSNQVRYSLADRGIEEDLAPYCRENDVTIIAYSPLATGLGLLDAGLGKGVLDGVARAAGKTKAQVALNWCVAGDNVVAIPKSDSAERTEENCGASGWRLTPEQTAMLEKAG